jgi:hypothetical protein
LAETAILQDQDDGVVVSVQDHVDYFLFRKHVVCQVFPLNAQNVSGLLAKCDLQELPALGEHVGMVADLVEDCPVNVVVFQQCTASVERTCGARPAR